MADFPVKDIKGTVVFRDDSTAFAKHAYCYATTSQEAPLTRPAAIVYAECIDDVKATIRYARDNNIAVSVRTGGHHYIGASSTSGDNVQLDMSGSMFKGNYADYPFRNVNYDAKTQIVTVGPAFPLDEFSAWMQTNKIFVPHGECPKVHIGGHIQSGGTGVLTPCFGFLADYMQSITIVTADGENGDPVVRTVTRQATNQYDKDLFWAVVGGCPGNFGVIVNCTMRVLRDEDYSDARGCALAYRFTQDRFERLLKLYAKWVDQGGTKKNYSFSISMLGGRVFVNKNETDAEHEKEVEEYNEEHGLPKEHRNLPVPIIAVGAIYAPHNDEKLPKFEDNEEAKAFFQEIREAAEGPNPITKVFWRSTNWLAEHLMGVGFSEEQHTPISEMLIKWTAPFAREYLCPFDKRIYQSTSTTLTKDGFPEWCTKLFQDVEGMGEKQLFDGFRAAGQFIPGGPACAPPDDRTSLSFRDSTAMMAANAWYDNTEHAYQNAHNWCKKAEECVGPNGTFSKNADRRYIWAPFNSWSLDEQRKHYFEDAIYERLVRVKRTVDPKHVFTPNLYCIDSINVPHANNYRKYQLKKGDSHIVAGKLVSCQQTNDVAMLAKATTDKGFFIHTPTVHREVLAGLEVKTTPPAAPSRGVKAAPAEAGGKRGRGQSGSPNKRVKK